VKASIDRALGNDSFMQLFQLINLKHISMVQWDHSLILIEVWKYGQQWPQGNHTFRYENVWQTHRDYDKVVKDLWQKADKGTCFLVLKKL
jgi:hypothetical protein